MWKEGENQVPDSEHVTAAWETLPVTQRQGSHVATPRALGPLRCGRWRPDDQVRGANSRFSASFEEEPGEGIPAHQLPFQWTSVNVQLKGLQSFSIMTYCSALPKQSVFSGCEITW